MILKGLLSEREVYLINPGKAEWNERQKMGSDKMGVEMKHVNGIKVVGARG